jgi:hypothetical protein
MGIALPALAKLTAGKEYKGGKNPSNGQITATVAVACGALSYSELPA